ncbi:hypothetical protein NEOKW01_0986 [Nematocida sp. AWRm80]|nr:hypothetical protein NEOKW01_0986 [Nematocida sp. AWRm80]
MDYLSWLSKTPAINKMAEIEEYIQKEKEEAVKLIRKRLKTGKDTNKQTAETILGEANRLYAKGMVDDSIDRIKEALKYCNTLDSAYYLLGVIYEEKKEAEKSFNAFLIAASIKKTDVDLWNKLYLQKKAENDLDYQVYLLKKIKKNKCTAEVLENLFTAYQQLNNKEKMFETQAELISHKNFNVEMIIDLINNIKELKNKNKIINIISKETNKEKIIKEVSTNYLIAYIDLLFIEERYYLIGELNNILVYLKRKTQSIRTEIILEFSAFIAECTQKCPHCKDSTHICMCKNNLFIDDSGNILLEYENESIIINTKMNLDIIADPSHLCLTNHFIEVLIKMKKYSFVQKMLIDIDALLDQTFNIETPPEPDLLDIHQLIVKERLQIKQSIAWIYEKQKNPDQAILVLKGILGYKQKLPHVQTKIFEEIKMKISQIYEKIGNLDLALEYALQINEYTVTEENLIQKDTLFFYPKSDCMHIRSLLHKAEHVYKSEAEINTVDLDYFISTAQELILVFLRNRFLFSQKPKKRKDQLDPETSVTKQLISTKEFETDYELLTHISGLGSIFYTPEESSSLSKSKIVYYDVLASLLAGVSIDQWISIFKRYISALCHKQMYSLALLLIKKLLTSYILRLDYLAYSSILWLAIKISIDCKNLDFLSSTINRLIPFYSHRSSIDSTSLYYLGYFLISKLKGFYKKKEFYVLQKNLQRSLKRKFYISKYNRLNILTLLPFSYMPSFVYANTIIQIEEFIDQSTLPKVDTSLLGISRAIGLSSLFLIHASSRKVRDRNKYIKKGISILLSQIESLHNIQSYTPNTITTSNNNNQITYTLEENNLSKYYYSEDNQKEKLALLQYNVARAYHQYKLLGLAEKYYLQSLRLTNNLEVVNLIKMNLFILGKTLIIK